MTISAEPHSARLPWSHALTMVHNADDHSAEYVEMEKLSGGKSLSSARQQLRPLIRHA